MTISQRPTKPTAAQEREAYQLCTERDMGRCVRCGSAVGVQRDHRKGRGVGGETVVWNLQLLCQACHQNKTEHPYAAILDGFTVPGWCDPRETPARRLVFGELRWVLYGGGTTYALLTDVQARTIRADLGII